jgi:phosphoribosylformylglycinamidine synthase subunit PurL
LLAKLGDDAPEYDRPWIAPTPPTPLGPMDLRGDVASGLMRLLASPNGCSRRWVYEQYDSLVRGQTLAIPGGDAGIVRVNEDGKALAFTADVTPRYVEADPCEGAKQAVAECWRNLTAVGALPLAVTDNLNFGNPQRPEVMGGFVAAIKGLGEACRALDFPIVSGNVSLYNETNGVGILPTPAIAAVGLIEAGAGIASARFADEGHAIILLGAPPSWGTHMGQSQYLADVLSLEAGPPPPVDLEHERRAGDFLRPLIADATIASAHDLSSGGLALALAEMALASGIGATINTPPALPVPAFFGEDQGRYLISLPAERVDALMQSANQAGLNAAPIGTTGGKELKLGASAGISVEDMRAAFEGWFPAFMSAPHQH